MAYLPAEACANAENDEEKRQGREVLCANIVVLDRTE